MATQLAGLVAAAPSLGPAMSLVAIGVLNVLVGVRILRTRTAGAAKPVFLALFGIALWTASQGLLLLATGQAVGFWLYTGIHVGALVGVTGVLHFSLSYAGYTDWLRPRRLGPVYAVTALWSLGFLTNPSHTLLTVPYDYGGQLVPVLEFLTPLYWAHIAYDWSLTSIGVVLMFSEYRRAERGGVYAKQSGLIVVALLIPFVPNILAYAGVTATNYSVWAFGVTGLLIATSLFRYQWLDLVPVGRDKVIEQVRDGYLVVDEQWRVVDANASARSLLEAEDLVGQSVETVLPDCLPLLRGEETERQLTLPSAVVTVSASPVTTESVDGHLLMLRDITERRRAQRRFQSLIENVSDIITVVDADGTITYESPSVQAVTGRPPDETVGENILDRVHPADRAEAEQTFADLRDEPGAERRFEYRLELGGEDYRVFEGVVTNLLDDDTVEGIVVASRDVTHRRQREQELETLNRRLQLALAGTNTGVWDWELETDEITLDDQAEALFGFEPGEFTGSYDQYIDAIHPEDVRDVEATRDRALEEGTYEAEFRIWSAGETVRWLNSRAEVFYEAGTPVRILGIVSDITERKQRERELEATQRDLEQSNEKLEEFAGVVSHDLRNPLNVVLTRSELAQRTGDLDHVAEAVSAAERMSAMIDDLLTLSRAGRTVEDPGPVSLAAVARDGWDNVQTDGGELELPAPADATVRADRDRLLNVFENLFRNATEHNEPPVTVRVGLLDPEDTDTPEASLADTPDGGVAGFYVADDGSGIPDGDTADIFDRGYTTATDGTGFGLSIVRDIVAAHDWDVTHCESRAGGARFEIRTNRDRIDT